MKKKKQKGTQEATKDKQPADTTKTAPTTVIPRKKLQRRPRPPYWIPRKCFIPRSFRTDDRRTRYQQAVLKRLDDLIRVRLRRSVRETLETSIQIGEALIKLKLTTPHGMYLAAIQERWGWSPDQAENYVKIFRNAESIRHLAETHPDCNQWELLRMINQEHARRILRTPLLREWVRQAMQRGDLTDEKWAMCRRIVRSGLTGDFDGVKSAVLARQAVEKGWTTEDLCRLYNRVRKLGVVFRPDVVGELVYGHKRESPPDDPPPSLPDTPLTDESIANLVTSACYGDPASADAKDLKNHVEELAEQGARYREELAWVLRLPQASPLARRRLRPGAPLRTSLDKDQRKTHELLEQMQQVLELCQPSRDARQARIRAPQRLPQRDGRPSKHGGAR